MSQSAPPPIPERLLDMIPGGLVWAGLILVVVGAIAAPLLVVWWAALLATYSAVRFTLAGGAALWGLRLVRRWEQIDWSAEYVRRASANSLPLDSVHHVVIIPNYCEELATLRRTLDQLAQQSNARSAISVVMAMEYGEIGAAEKGHLLRASYADQFENFFVAVHPQGLPGEMQCKSANLAWAARWAKRVLVDEMGYDLRHLVVTVMDSDTLWHPRYFASLGALFATDPQRHSTFWQAPIRYHGNIWSTNPLLRILHAYSSAWELAYLAAPWWKALPMSSYSMSLLLVDRAGYWDPNVIADEWHMFIKTFFSRDGDLRLQPIFLPFYACATGGNGIWQSIKERYLQTLRHAWGAKEIGYTVSRMNVAPEAPFWPSFVLLVRVAHDNLLAGFGWVIMTLGAQLPLLFHPVLFHDLKTAPFVLLQIALLLVLALTILFWLIDLRIRPRRSYPWTWRERLYEWASLPLLAVLILCCVALPVLHAQSRLLLGRPIRFRVTLKT